MFQERFARRSEDRLKEVRVKKWQLKFDTFKVYVFEVLNEMSALIVEHKKQVKRPAGIVTLDTLEFFLYAFGWHAAKFCPVSR